MGLKNKSMADSVVILFTKNINVSRVQSFRIRTSTTE